MAHRVFHRSLTAGVALVGAGAIAFSTMPVLPSQETAAAPSAVTAQVQQFTPRVVTAEVDTVAFVRYLEILGAGASAALKESFSTWNTDIPALFDQVGIGVEGAQWEDPDLLRWNHSLLGAALFAPIAPLFVGPFTDSVAEALAQTFPSRGAEIREKLPQAVDYAFARLVGPIISAIGATGATHQRYYAAGMEGDRIGQWAALLSAPIDIVKGFLFGGYGDISALITGEVGGPRIAAPGLLTPWGQYPEDKTVTDTFEDVPMTAGRTGAEATTQTVSTEQAAETTAEDAETPSAADVTDETTTVIETTETDATETPAVEATEDTEESDEATAFTETTETTETDDADGTEKTETAPSGKKVRGEKTVSTEKADKPEATDQPEKADKASGDAE